MSARSDRDAESLTDLRVLRTDEVEQQLFHLVCSRQISRQLLLGAEKIALRDYPWIPWRFRVTQNLVQPWVKGFVSNVRDYNRSRWLWIAGKPGR